MKSFFTSYPWFSIILFFALVFAVFGSFRYATMPPDRIDLNQVQYITAYSNGALICTLSNREKEAFVAAFEELELKRMLITTEKTRFILGYEHRFSIIFFDGNQSNIIIARPYIIVDGKYYKCSDESWNEMGIFIQSIVD